MALGSARKLKLNGKDDRLRRSDFLRFAATIGLKNSAATAAIDWMLSSMSKSLERIALPRGLNYDSKLERMVASVLKICRSRLESFRGKGSR
jgi:serine/threonine-protein kinase HipA